MVRNKTRCLLSLESTSHYDEDYMTVEQVNLLLKTMPLDITYVNESDKVIFYNRAEERVFPRSAAIIGREAKFYHPPKKTAFGLGLKHTAQLKTKQVRFWLLNI